MPKPSTCMQCGREAILASNGHARYLCAACLERAANQGRDCAQCGRPWLQCTCTQYPTRQSSVVDRYDALCAEHRAERAQPLSSTISSIPPADAPADARKTIPSPRRAR